MQPLLFARGLLTRKFIPLLIDYIKKNGCGLELRLPSFRTLFLFFRAFERQDSAEELLLFFSTSFFFSFLFFLMASDSPFFLPITRGDFQMSMGSYLGPLLGTLL